MEIIIVYSNNHVKWIREAIINDLDGKKLVYFQNGCRYKHETASKQEENSLRYHWQHCNISAITGAPITIKAKWCFQCKK
jgi:hypothetical protein